MLNPKANANKLLAQSRMIQKTLFTNVRYADDIFRSKVKKCCRIKKKKKTPWKKHNASHPVTMTCIPVVSGSHRQTTFPGL